MKAFYYMKFVFLVLVALGSTNIYAQVTKTASGSGVDWHDANTWSPSGMPSPSDNVIIPAGKTVYINNTTGDITRNSGTTTLVAAGGSLQTNKNYTNNGSTTIIGEFQINPGGMVSGNQFDYQNVGTLSIFALPYIINATDPVWPMGPNRPFNVLVKLNPGAANASTNTLTINGSRTVNGLVETFAGIITPSPTFLTIDNTLRIKGVGYVGGNDVQYIAPATLEYATGGNYDRNSEWPSGSNTPSQVTISGGTKLYMNQNGGGTSPRTVKGNLTITDANSLLDMVNISVPLTVEGNVNVTNGGSLKLSTNIYGDLKLGGNISLHNSSALTTNKGAIILNGGTASGTDQVFTCPDAATISYLAFENPSPNFSTFIVNCPNLYIRAQDGGGVIDWDLLGVNNGNNIIDINNNILRLGADGGTLTTGANGNGWFKGSPTSTTTAQLHFYAPGDMGIIKFVNGYQNIRRLRVYKAYRQKAATLGSDLYINGPELPSSDPYSTDNLQFGNNSGSNQGGLVFLGNYNLHLKAGATHNVSVDFIWSNPPWIFGGYVVTDGMGEFRRYVTSSAFVPYTIPIGDANNFSGVMTLLTANTTQPEPYIGYRVTPSKHPQVESTTNYLKRYWSMTTFGLTVGTGGFDNRFAYQASDCVGSESTMEQGTWQPEFPRWWAINPMEMPSKKFIRANLSSVPNLPNVWDVTAAKPLKFQEIVVKENNNSGTEYQTNDTYTFQNASPGTTSTVKFFITNYLGTEDLNISNITISGTGYSIASIKSGANNITPPILLKHPYRANALPSSISATSGLTVTINLDPAIMGSHPGELRIYNNDPDDGESPYFVINLAADAKTLPTDVFRSNVANGVWSTPSNWESAKTIAGPWFTATLAPTNQAGGIFIRNGHTIQTDNDATSMKAAIVESGGTLQQKSQMMVGRATGGSPVVQLTIQNGGTLTVEGDYGLNNPMLGVDLVLVNTGGTVNAGATLEGTNFTAQYAAITGRVSYEQDAIFNWDSPLSFFSNGTASFFKMSTPGTYVICNINAAPAGSSFDNTTANGSFNALLNLNIPNLAFVCSTRVKTIIGGITGNSNVSINNTSGSVTFANGSVIGSAGDNLNFNITNNGIKTAASATVTIPQNANVKIAGTVANNDIALGGTSNLQINGNLDITDMQIAASTGTVTVGSTGKLLTGSTFNLVGTTAATGAIYASAPATPLTLATGSTVEYNRLGDQPIQASPGGQTYHHLILSGSGNKTAQAASTIALNGDLSKTTDAVFQHNNGKVLFSGSTLQNYNSPNSALPYFTFKDLEISNTTGLSVNDSMAVAGKLGLVSNGKINLNNATVHLLSTAAGTANVGIISGGSTINYTGAGQFSVQRYMASKRKWQLLSVPTNNTAATTARANWQENEAVSMTKPGWGVKITDSLLTAVSNGFDAKTHGPSVKYFSNALSGYVGIPNTTSYDLSSTPTSGYFVYHYGDRSASLNPTTTLRTWGKLYTGPASSPSIAPGQMLIVGNPYASQVDMRNVTFAGSAVLKFYIWDPKLAGDFASGAYQTISRANAGQNFIITPGGGSYGSNGSVQNFIESGQAIVVENTGSSAGIVSFNETDKADGSIQAFRMELGTAVINDLYRVAADSATSTLFDGVLTVLNSNYSTAINEQDAPKLSYGDNYLLALVQKGATLAVDRRSPLNSGDTIHYKLGALQNGNYYFDLYSNAYEANGLTAYMVDEYLKTKTPVDLVSGEKYAFSINSAEPESRSPYRFYIVFTAREVPVTVAPAEMVILSNPVRNSMLEISLNNFVPGKYQATIHQPDGRRAAQFGFTISSSSYKLSQKLPMLPAGVYTVSIADGSGAVNTRKFIIQ